MKSPTLAFTVGSGRFEEMGLYLARSINERTDHDTHIFIPTDEYDAISEDGLREFEQLCSTIFSGPTSIPEYSQSAKLDAFVSATKHHSPPYILLDTDTLVTQSLDGICDNTEIAAKPVDIGKQYWGQPCSLDEWKSVYADHGISMPEWRTTSTVDQVVTIPYFNAGVVATATENIPEELLNITKSVYEHLTNAYYADQVALALLMVKYEHRELTEWENYPCPLRFRFPDSIRVLHYHSQYMLRRLWYSRYRGLLNDVGAGEAVSSDSFLDRFLSTCGSVYHLINGRFTGI